MAYINEKTAKFYQTYENDGKLIVTSLEQGVLSSQIDAYRHRCKCRGLNPTLNGLKEYIDEQNIYNCYIRILNVTNLNL